ncbi:MAG: Calcium-binding EF-hand-containing protein [Caulobacter sp.]|nr:Calcium-binding EF-hand-containing protein [Caulobacter sp.]
MSLSISGSSGFLQAQQAMFAKLDLNTDGALSSDEFSALQGIGGQNLPSGGGARQLKGGGGFQGFSTETLGALIGVQQMSHADRAAEIFSNADADGDGSLTAEELSADMAAHAPPGAGPGVGGTDSASRAADLVSVGDTDGDGALSAEEFTALKPQGGPPPGPPTGNAEEEKTYDAADTNRDGTVSMSELLTSLQGSSDVASGFSSDVSDLMAKLLEKLQAEVTSSTEAVTA